MALIRRDAGDWVTKSRKVEHEVNMCPDVAQTEPPVGSGELQPGLDIVALYDDHFDFVWRSLRRLGVHPQDLEDAAQDVFVVVHRRLDSFAYRSSPKTWMFGIALRVAKAYRRRGARRHAEVESDETTLVCSLGTPEENQARMQAAECVQTLLEHLDDDKRAVFVLAELERMSARDIAQALGIPQNTVYSRLRLAREAFEESVKRLKAKDDWRIR